MTLDTRDITFDNTSDANFRAWGSAVSASLAAVGLVKTADTGQIDWTTAVRPTAPTTTPTQVVVGYELWGFNDALQATKPVYIKVEYGYYTVANSTHATSGYGGPVLWITASSATTGAGEVAGLATQRTQLHGVTTTYAGYGGSSATANTHVATASPCITSGDLSSVAMCIGATAAQQANQTYWGSVVHHFGMPIMWSVERTRDSAGNPTGDGIALMSHRWVQPAGLTTAPTTVANVYQLLSFVDTGAVGTASNYWPVAWPGVGFNTTATATVIAFWPMPIGAHGIATQALSWLGTYKADVPFGTILSLSVMGATHTYISLTNMGGTVANDQARGGNLNTGIPLGQLLMRYE